MSKNRMPAHNSRFAKAGASCFYDSEVLNSIFVHQMKFSAEKTRLRKAAKRYRAWLDKPNEKSLTSKIRRQLMTVVLRSLRN